MNRQLEKGSRWSSDGHRGEGGTRTDPSAPYSTLPGQLPAKWVPTAPCTPGTWQSPAASPNGDSDCGDRRVVSPGLPELLEQAGPVLIAAAPKPAFHLPHCAAALLGEHFHIGLRQQKCQHHATMPLLSRLPSPSHRAHFSPNHAHTRTHTSPAWGVWWWQHRTSPARHWG